MALPPKKKRILSAGFDKRVILIHGGAGIGKSTLASLFPDNYFLATEPGVDFLDIYPPLNCPTYEKFLGWCKELMASDHKGFITIDTYDKLVLMCTEYILKRESQKDKSGRSFDHPSDIGSMGKGWALITWELDRVLTKLAQRFGLIIICHTKMIEVEDRVGRKYFKAEISVGGNSGAIVTDMAYYKLYVDKEREGKEEITVIRTRPSLYWDAKDKSGKLPPIIKYPLGLTYESLTKYFKEAK